MYCGVSLYIAAHTINWGKKGKKSRYNFRTWSWKICEILVLVNDVQYMYAGLYHLQCVLLGKVL